MKMKHAFFAVPLLLLALAGANAQTGVQTLTVDEAVRIALAGNLSLQRNAIDLGGKQRAADRSWNSLIPTVSAGAQVSRPAEQNDWMPGFSLSAGLTLSASIVDTIKKARADYEAGILTYEQAKQELELQTRKLFYQILLLESNRALAAQSLETAQARYEQSAASARRGQVSRLEEMTARVDMENRRPNLRNAETQYENALDSFKTLLNIPSEMEIALSGTLRYEGGPIPEGTGRGESLETAVLQKNIKALEAQRGAAWTEAYTPSLRLSWSAAPLYSGSLGKWNDSGSISVSLGLNLDNFLPWSAAKTQLDSIDDSIRSAAIQLDETMRNSGSRIAQYRRTIEQTKGTIEALILNVDLARTAYSMYEEAYRNGVVDYQTLRDAGDSLLEAENRVSQEQYNLISAVLDLEKELHVPFGTIK
jgi:outer membrane protein TolC